ncbi:histidinol-phosphate aminotransferase [Allopseudospirillum japonicum]|uniref:Histidinol-phosphate aminotransferase n=1 Tax=Allopseudospirillum japonicum TaxID=64971 RepID=A0A1H6SMW3_9GAMM|nr:histidinol-phosphate transaminase [Allopseudospirillum japonicum]SEI65185.1 histidinol-phosphate aminotransferase [Allopseudospirillum japonicum]
MHSCVSEANAGILGLQPYQAGKPIEELARELGLDPQKIIKLASNENPLGPSPRIIATLEAAVTEVSRYPDGNGFALKQALAEHLDVLPEQITLGNGSNDVLELIARTYLNPNTAAMYSQHAFAVYPLATQACGAQHQCIPAIHWGHDLEAMAQAITEHTRIVFIANPNNPTGTWLSEQQIHSFLAQVPASVIVVLDEAYFEYVEESLYPNGLSLLQQYPNLIVTRTFSKAYGLAGLRVGYSVSSVEIADLLNRVRQPFNVNIMAQVCAQEALADEAYLQQSRALNRAGLIQLEQEIRALGLEYIPSVGNFLCIDFKQDALPIYQALLREGVIVRPVAAYQMPHHLRVSVGTEAENQGFIDALTRVLE